MGFRDTLYRTTTPLSRHGLSLSGAVYNKAVVTVDELTRVRDGEARNARVAGKVLLTQICDSLDIPIEERAAWSAAFHGGDRDTLSTVGGFVQEAESYGARLSAIDEQLREPGVPIVGFTTGSPGSDLHPQRYAYRVGDGSGLEYQQRFNKARGYFHHFVSAAEEPLLGETNRLDEDRGGPLISNIPPEKLVDLVVGPEVAADMLRFGCDEPTRVLVIGGQAVHAMFSEAGSTRGSDSLLGHAVRLGFRPEF